MVQIALQYCQVISLNILPNLAYHIQGLSEKQVTQLEWKQGSRNLFHFNKLVSLRSPVEPRSPE